MVFSVYKLNLSFILCIHDVTRIVSLLAYSATYKWTPSRICHALAATLTLRPWSAAYELLLPVAP